MKLTLILVALIIVILPLTVGSIQQRPFGIPEAQKLYVGDYVIDAKLGDPDMPANLRQFGVKARGEFLVQFDGRINKLLYSKLLGEGADIIQYYPNNAYLIRLPQERKEHLRLMSGVQFLSDFHPAYKAPKALFDLTGSLSLTTYFYHTPEAENDIRFIENLGGQIFERSIGTTSSGAKLIQVNFHNVNAADLVKIANLPEVHVMERWANAIPEDERSSQIIAGNVTSGVPDIGYGNWQTTNNINGAGVTVFDDDTGLDSGNTATLHQDLRGRVVFRVYNGTSCQDTGGHGTHTSGIIAGNGALGTNDNNGYRLGLGVAPQANLYFANGLGGTNPGANTLGPDAVTDPDGAGTFQAATVTSFSWTDGKGDGVKYNSEAAAWDARVRDASTTVAGNQPLTVVFSAGNSGSASSTLTSPKAAKNIITVGNSYNYRPNDTDGSGCTVNPNNIDTVAPSSSRGPTGDGRIKPDVTAPGTVISSLRSYSATYSCAAQGGTSCCSSAGFTGSADYILMEGTSMACPHVAGAGALIQQWWRNGHSGATPSPAMAKAILINGAVDMGTADIPNNNEGWGRINLTNSMFPGVPVVYHDQDFSLQTAGQQKTYSFTVSNTSRRVRVNLVWSDPPGAVYTGTTAAPNQPNVLVNNLNLSVTNGTSTYLGNVFSAGQSTTGGTADSKNNVESVYLPASSTGAWTVTVTATTLNGKGDPTLAVNNQDFALVISDATESAGDTTAPTTSITAPAAGSTVSGSTTVSANASDAVGVTKVEFYAGATLIGADTTSPYSISWNTTAVTNGSYTLTSKAYDAANNVGTSAGVSVTVNNVAVTGLTNGTFETGNLTGWTSVGTTGVLSGTVHGGTYADRNGSTIATNGDSNIVQTFTVPTGGGTISFWYKMTCPDSVTYDWATATLVNNTTATTTTLLAKSCATNASWVQVTSGTLTAGHSMTLTLTSHDDNYASDPSYTYFDDVVFTGTVVDTTAPTTSITAPSNGATVANTVTVTASASDAVGVTKVEFYTGATLIGTDTTSPYSISWNTTTVANGSYSLTSKAYDAANNIGTSAAVSVTVNNDLTAPTTSITAPTAGSTVAGTTTVSASASDSVGVTKVEIYVDSVLKSTITTVPYNYSWDTTTYSNASHTIFSKAYDAANNVGTSSTISATVNNPSGPPALTAAYSATFKAPACGSGGKSCDTGATLINGRGTMTSGNETNRPNTINSSCADGNSGTYHTDESIDRISIATNDSTALAGGKAVTVSVTVWCWGTADKMDLYYTTNTTTPSWTLIGTQACTAGGVAKTFTAGYTLPTGSTSQAVRATFRYNGTASACGTNSGYDDHDDLVFGAQ